MSDIEDQNKAATHLANGTQVRPRGVRHIKEPRFGLCLQLLEDGRRVHAHPRALLALLLTPHRRCSSRQARLVDGSAGARAALEIALPVRRPHGQRPLPARAAPVRTPRPAGRERQLVQHERQRRRPGDAAVRLPARVQHRRRRRDGGDGRRQV